jgi:hypothetical protein
MTHICIVAVPGQPPRVAKLTTASSASSYGQPVIVLEGNTYGPGEVLWLDGAKETREWAGQHGYQVLSNENSRWDIMGEVITAAEAAVLWELDESTVKRACQQGRFEAGEYRKTGKEWLVTLAGMRRVFGQLE